MSSGNDQLRTALDNRFQPPIDVLLDPSLLVASISLERLPDSNVFASQTQATLGERPTQPRIGELYVPTTFRGLIEGEDQLDVQQTSAWDFYCGQAERAFRDDIIDALDQNNVNQFGNDSTESDLQWEHALDDPARQDRLREILSEEYVFLQSGGVVLSRTPRFIESLRDAGVPTVDVGKAKLASVVQETLTDIGYTTPAAFCAFGVATAESTIDALVGNLLSTHADLLLYRLGP